MENIIEIKNLVKKYKKFTLDIPALDFPKGFATALIGENGAGKSTLLDILSGVDLDFKGDIKESLIKSFQKPLSHGFSWL